jgi:TrmH family RNA methyltransferase
VITIKKLSSLKESTKIAKCARLIDQYLLANSIEFNYIKEVALIVSNTEYPLVSSKTKTLSKAVFLLDKEDKALLIDLNLALHLDLGLEKGDWDFEVEMQQSSSLNPFAIVLDRLRSPFNVGSVFRTADSFGVSEILIVGQGATIEHPRAIRTSCGCDKTVKWQKVEQQQLIGSLKGKNVFALESGGEDINNFEFPYEGFLIVGNEELGVSPQLLELADNSLGRVTIPLYGTKGSLNVSVAFGIMMQMWHTKVANRGSYNGSI